MEDNKPWYASLGFMSGIGAAMASFGTAYISYKGGNFEAAMGAVVAGMSGLGAAIGRAKAKQPIGKPAPVAPK
jgi:hypothetical protein